MVSPCITCEFKMRPKEKCTENHNFCQKLLDFQSHLQTQDLSSNVFFSNRYNSVALSKRRGAQA